jgi:hypothetical protein
MIDDWPGTDRFSGLRHGWTMTSSGRVAIELEILLADEAPKIMLSHFDTKKPDERATHVSGMMKGSVTVAEMLLIASKRVDISKLIIS